MTKTFLKTLCLSLLALIAGSAWAQNVAKVGTTEYATIDEAIANWTSGTTLTLLDNVQLTTPIVVTEKQTLNLSTFTMTAANNQHAIKLEGTGNCNLTIYADATNPGTIKTSSSSYSTVYANYNDCKYKKTLTINNGIFEGPLTLNKYQIGNSGEKGTPLAVTINGGVFTSSITSYRNYYLTINGGTFEKFTGSTAYQTSTCKSFYYGGRFKNTLTTTSGNSRAYYYGSVDIKTATKTNYYYIDDEGYYVLTEGASYLPTEYEAIADGYRYTEADLAIQKATSVTLFASSTESKTIDSGKTMTIDATDANAVYSGTITLTGMSTSKSTFVIKVKDTNANMATVVSNNPTSYPVKTDISDPDENGVITYTYSTQTMTLTDGNAMIGTTYYANVFDAFCAADGTTDKTIKQIKDETTASIKASSNTEVIYDLNGCTFGLKSLAIGSGVNATMTIVDNSEAKTGKVTNTLDSFTLIGVLGYLSGDIALDGTYNLIVKAGTWQFNPEAFEMNGETFDLVPDGYTVTDNGDGTYTVKEVLPVIIPEVEKELVITTDEQQTIPDDKKEEVAAAVVAVFTQNSSVNNMTAEETNINNAVSGEGERRLKVELTSAVVAAETITEQTTTTTTTVKGATFEVKPVYVDENGQTVIIDNKDIIAPITFRLAVQKNIQDNYAKVWHQADSDSPKEYLGVFPIQTANDEKYIQLSASKFSFYNYLTQSIEETTLVAQIGEAKYYETLAEAVNAAEAGDVVEILIAGTYTIPALPKNITIKGTVDGVVLDCVGSGNIVSIPDGATFQNLTFEMGSTEYHGFYHAGYLLFKDCVINGYYKTYGKTKFDGCTFNQKEYAYSLHAYGLDLELSNCTFNNVGKGMYVYQEGSNHYDVKISDCTFNVDYTGQTKSKAQIFVKNNIAGQNYNVRISGCTINATGENHNDDPDLTNGGDYRLWNIEELGNGPASENVYVYLEGKQVYPIVYVAQIGEAKFETLAEAIAAVPTDGTETTITMIADETIKGNAGVTVAAGRNIVLDLNGKTISNLVNENKASQVIKNNGTLTINDSSDPSTGKITNAVDKDTNAGEWWSKPQYNYATNVITNSGNLIINGGEIYETAASSICYAVDNNSSGSDAILTVNGGYIHKDSGSAVRMFCNSTTKENTANVNGGKIEGGYAGIWIQLPGSSAQKKLASLNVTGGTIEGGTYAFYDNTYGDIFDETQYNLSGGTFDGDIFSYGANMTITDGTYSGEIEIKQTQPSRLSVTGGKFSGDICAYGDNASTGFISGGVYKNITFEHEQQTDSCHWTSSIDPRYEAIYNTDEATKEEYPYTVGLKEQIIIPEVEETLDITTDDEQQAEIPDDKKEEVAAAVVAALTQNSSVNNMTAEETNINDAVPVSETQVDSERRLKVELTSAVVAAETITEQTTTTTTTVKGATFEVKPVYVYEEGGVTKTEIVRNEDIKAPITFRLAVQKNIQDDCAKVWHQAVVYDQDGKAEADPNSLKEYLGVFPIQTAANGEKYIQLSASKFSFYTYLTQSMEETTEITITTADDLVALAEYVNSGHTMKGKTIKLGADIDMTGVAMQPIGTETNKFSGTFDGQEHAIANLTMSLDHSGAGLFGYVWEATIKDLKLTNVNITNTGADYTGGIAGHGYANISGCTVKGTIQGVEQVGGVIGYLSCGSVKNCVVDVKVTATTSRAGGIAGKANVDSEYHINNNTIKCEVSSPDIYAGGIVGQIMATDNNTYEIKDNEITEFTVSDGGNVIGNVRSGSFVTSLEANITGNKWNPAGGVASLTDGTNSLDIHNANKAPVAKIGETKYNSLAEAIAAVQDGTETTITMIEDVDIAHGISVPSGKNFTVDFDGHTYTLGGHGAGSANTKTNGFQLLEGSTITFKNGTINCSEANKDRTWTTGSSEPKGIAMLIQNYANLTLDGMTIDGTNVARNGAATRYVVSNNSGDVNFTGATTITAADGDFAFDVYQYGTYPVPTVTIADKNVTINGKIEATGGNIVISAGSFKVVVEEAWCATGFQPVTTPNSEGMYTVEKSPVAKIGETEYKTLADAIAAVPTDGTETTITMIADVTGADGISVASGKNFTVDFDGHTYTLGGDGAGSAGTQTQGFQLLQGSTITFKNGTINCSEANKDRTWTPGSSDPKGIAMLIQNYANLTLDGMTIDGGNIAHNDPAATRYVVSNNSGDVNFTGATTITAVDNDFAFDVYKYGTYPVPTVTINSENVTITGNIEATGGKLNISAGTVNGTISTGTGYTEGDIAISGGSFSEEVKDEYCAKGFQPVTDEQGKYTVKEKDVVLKVYGYENKEDMREMRIHEFLAAQQTYHNAMAVVSSSYSEDVEGLDNVILDYVVGKGHHYECENFVIDDMADFWYSPVSFVAISGYYTRHNLTLYNSVCVPFEVNATNAPEGATLMQYRYSDELKSNVYFEQQTYITAGQGFLMQATPDYDWTVTFNETPISNGIVSGAMTGSYVTKTIGEGYFKVNDKGDKFTNTKGTSHTYPFRSYLDLTGEIVGGGASVQSFNIIFNEEGTTGILGTSLQNEDTSVYDINGIQQNTLQRGVNVVRTQNGYKKVIK